MPLQRFVSSRFFSTLKQNVFSEASDTFISRLYRQGRPSALYDELYKECAFSKENNLKNVLDAGTGPGFLAEIIANKTKAKVWGVDTSKTMLNIAREYNSDSDKITYVEGNLENLKALPYSVFQKDGQFDGIVAANMIRLVNDQLLFLNEMARILRDDGTLCICYYNIKSFGSSNKSLQEFYQQYPVVSTGSFTPDKSLLKDSHFVHSSDNREDITLSLSAKTLADYLCTTSGFIKHINKEPDIQKKLQLYQQNHQIVLETFEKKFDTPTISVIYSFGFLNLRRVPRLENNNQHIKRP